jgi:tetratricopeptide (TPR) repeat protein
MRAPFWPDITDRFAEAYAEIARSGANMRLATEALESIRDALNSTKDVFQVWEAANEQMGRADVDRVLPILTKISLRLREAAIARTVEDLNEEFRRDRERGWRSWLEIYARTLDVGVFWKALAGAIARDALLWSPSPRWPVERIQAAVRAHVGSRWPETYNWILFLGEQDMPPRNQANFLAIAAEIQIFHFLRQARAKELLIRADQLASGEPIVLAAWGEYWLLVDEPEKAHHCFDRLVKDRPDLALGFVGLGDTYEKTNESTTAESYYKQAIANAPGASDGFRRLMAWYGKKEWFEERHTLIPACFSRLEALVSYPPDAWVELGCIYKLNERYAEARDCFQRTIDEDPSYSLGHVWLGYTWLDQAMAVGVGSPEAARPLAEARSCFDRTTQVAPDSLDGYWALTRLAEELGDREAALSWCKRALACHPEWEPFVLTRRAALLSQSGKLEEAERDLARSIELEPVNPGAADGLADLAERLGENHNDAKALRVLERAREIKGKSWESQFQNRIGNLRYRSGDYEAAADSYRLAIASAPADDVLNSNLALALERMRRPGKRLEEIEEAVKALRRAIDLKPTIAEYTTRLTDLESERAYIRTYGEDALQFEPGVAAIRVDLREGYVNDILDANAESLSAEMLEKTEAMRTKLRERYGVTIPGVRYGMLEELWRPSDYRIRIMEQSEYRGNLRPGGWFIPAAVSASDAPTAPAGEWLTAPVEASSGLWNVPDYLLHHLESVLEHHLGEFIGHQEAANLLKKSGADTGAEIVRDPKMLACAVWVMRALLRRRLPIKAIGRIADEIVTGSKAGRQAHDIVERLAAVVSVPV